LFDLVTGTILAIFHTVGKQADAIDRLNSLVTDGAILEATAFSILAEIPSGPLDLAVSSLLINHCTSQLYIESLRDTDRCGQSHLDQKAKGR